MLGRLALALGIAACATLPMAARAADTFVNVLTGGTSGVYYPLGIGLAKVWAEGVPGLRPSIQATRGSVENLTLLHDGKGEIAFTLGDSLAAAWKGAADAGFDRKLDRLRGIAAIYPSYIQIVASQDSGIRTLADLKGKRLSVGAQKSGTELNTRAILAAAGLKYDDLGKVEYLPFAESVDLIRKGDLDATLQSAGLGVASIRDLASAGPITIVEVPADIIAKVGPPFVEGTIPAGTYGGQATDVKTAAVPNFLVTRDGVSDELVYQMTKAMFEKLPDLAAAHSAARDIRLDDAAKGMPIPLHPGAERFYRERGIAM